MPKKGDFLQGGRGLYLIRLKVFMQYWQQSQRNGCFNQVVVEGYQQAIKSGAPIKPAIIENWLSETNTIRTADGRHRLTAAALCGVPCVYVRTSHQVVERIRHCLPQLFVDKSLALSESSSGSSSEEGEEVFQASVAQAQKKMAAMVAAARAGYMGSVATAGLPVRDASAHTEGADSDGDSLRP